MTQEEFIKVLDEEGYSYKIEGDKIVVLTGVSNGFTHHIFFNFKSLKSLPPGVVFSNTGGVHLESLKSLPPDVQFKMWDDGVVYLSSLTSIPPEVQFSTAAVRLDSIVGGGDGWFSQWKGNIKGINSRRLLNFMISKGIFER